MINLCFSYLSQFIILFVLVDIMMQMAKTLMLIVICRVDDYFVINVGRVNRLLKYY